MKISRVIVLHVFSCLLIFAFIFMPQVYADIEKNNKSINAKKILKNTEQRKDKLNSSSDQRLKKLNSIGSSFCRSRYVTNEQEDIANDRKIVAEYLKNANQGDVMAQILLGYQYLFGTSSVTKDVNQAMVWFKKSANNRYVKGQSILGSLYSRGIHVPKDMSKANYWYSKAAKQGDKEAIEFLKNLNKKTK